MSALTAEQVEVAADPRALYELSLAEKRGDGAPLLPPTDDVVQALLDATPHPAAHVVGALPPRHGVATVERIAISSRRTGGVAHVRVIGGAGARGDRTGPAGASAASDRWRD